MEEELFILYSGRGQGWLSKAGHYVSTRTDARQFNYEEMLDYCRVHYKNGMAEFGLIPVSLYHLKDIANDKR